MKRGTEAGRPEPATPPPEFQLLIKPTGAICNLACRYCYYLPKEALYPGSQFCMADELLELVIRQLIESHLPPSPEVTIAWQGGGPTLMGLDFFRQPVAIAEKHRRPGQRIAYSLQTNGTGWTTSGAPFSGNTTC